MSRRIVAALLGAAIALLAACAPTTSPANDSSAGAPAAATPPATVDPRAATAARIAALADTIDEAPVDARLVIDPEGAISITPAHSGRKLDVGASVERALHGEDSRVIREVAPTVTEDTLEPLRGRVEALLAQPVVVTFEDQAVPLTRADVAPLLWTGGTTLGIDATAAEALARLLAAELHKDAVNARFEWNAGELKVLRESAPGRDLDVDQATLRIVSALLADQHRIALPVYTVAPTVRSDDPQALGIRELIDSGSTSFAGSIPEKKANIKLAAERLNGVVVAPGATFSFNDELGPTTLDSGFQWGFAIAGGDSGPRTVPSVGGGICQVATTLFQPVFWAGFPLEERYAHAYWIPSYTSRGVVGLDVTVDSDANLDFRWTNPTSDYVLIQASTEGDTVRFALYGSKPSWSVDVPPAQISNERPADPTPITQDEPSMPRGKSLVVESARDGFDVTVQRVVTPRDGGEPRTLNLHSSYQPSHSVTLIGTG